MSKSSRQRAAFKKQIKIVYKAIDKSQMSEEWMLIANGFIHHRGMFSDVDTYIKWFEILSDRNNERIKQSILNDKLSSVTDEFGYFEYSTVGKDAGLGTYVVLSLDATDKGIRRFFKLLKEDKRSMTYVKTSMTEATGIDFKREIV